MLPLAADYPLLNIIWTMLVFFGLFLWIMLIFRAFADLFGRHDIGGWHKAAWAILIIVIPLIGVCVYLLAEGKGVAEREAARAQRSQGEFDDYVKTVAGASPAEDIAKAKALLDSGAIDADEFASLKAKALA
jgi:Phospholipase_D-nuclease N-terminal